jgi:hypothetical protein
VSGVPMAPVAAGSEVGKGAALRLSLNDAASRLLPLAVGSLRRCQWCVRLIQACTTCSSCVTRGATGRLVGLVVLQLH